MSVFDVKRLPPTYRPPQAPAPSAQARKTQSRSGNRFAAAAVDHFDEHEAADPLAHRLQSKQSRAGRRDDEAMRRNKREQLRDLELEEG